LRQLDRASAEDGEIHCMERSFKSYQRTEVNNVT